MNRSRSCRHAERWFSCSENVPSWCLSRNERGAPKACRSTFRRLFDSADMSTFPTDVRSRYHVGRSSSVTSIDANTADSMPRTLITSCPRCREVGTAGTTSLRPAADATQGRVDERLPRPAFSFSGNHRHRDASTGSWWRWVVALTDHGHHFCRRETNRGIIQPQ